MPYLVWIPLTILYYGFYAYLSRQSNLFGGYWSWGMFITGAVCPLWLLISRNTQNLLFDGVLYDILMFLSFTLTLLVIGEGQNWGFTQYLGLFLILTGLVLLKI